MLFCRILIRESIKEVLCGAIFPNQASLFWQAVINRHENRKYSKLSFFFLFSFKKRHAGSIFDSYPSKYAPVPSPTSCRLRKSPLNRLRKLLHCHFVSGNRVALSMIEQNGRVLVTNPIKRHRAMNVRIATAYYVACRDINHRVVLICEQRLDAPIDDADRGPTGKEDGALIVN